MQKDTKTKRQKGKNTKNTIRQKDKKKVFENDKKTGGLKGDIYHPPLLLKTYVLLQIGLAESLTVASSKIQVLVLSFISLLCPSPILKSL